MPLLSSFSVFFTVPLARVTSSPICSTSQAAYVHQAAPYNPQAAPGYAQAAPAMQYQGGPMANPNIRHA